MKKAFVLLSITAVLLSACSTSKENKIEEGKYPVTNPLIIDTVFTSEYVADIQSLQNVEIRARVKGYIEEVHVDEGKLVKAGQTLFSISSQHYKEELIKAKALVKSAIADAKSAELEVRNAQILLDKNVVSKTELEMAQSKWDAANAKVDEAKSNETTAALNLSLTDIKAPFDGVINRIPYKAGSLVDEGALLTSISNNKEVFAYFKVSEKEYLDFISRKNSNEKNLVSLVLANDQPYSVKGTIETVEGEFDKATGNIAFRARFANPDDILKHGSSGKILLKRELKNALLIPQKSTFEVQENIYVFVTDKNNIVQLRKITTPFRLSQLYVVGSGLLSEDKFIYEGIQKIKEGDKIVPETVQISEFKNH